jgi:hypothetical protein
MAHTFGNASTRASSTATTITSATYTPTTGATALVLVLWVGGATNRAGGTPTFAGQNLTQANSTQKAAASPESSVEIWYLIGTPTVPSSGTASIPNSGGLTIDYTLASCVAGTGMSSAFDVAAGSNGTSTNPTCGAFSGGVAANSFQFAAVASGAQTFAPSARTGTSIEEADIGARGLGLQYLATSGAGALTMSWTFGTSDDWGAVAVSFKEAADTTLAASRTATATVAADLSTAIQGAASLSAAASVSAALTTAITPAASLSASATIAADLTVAAGSYMPILLEDGTELLLEDGTDLLHEDSSATSGDGNLAASLTATAAVSADLTTAIEAAAALSASGSMSAALTTAIPLASDVSATAALDAALTTAIEAASSLTATGAVSADLSTAIEAAATLAASATVAADLSTAITLAAAPTATATIAADLRSDTSLAATLATAASLGADLSTAIPLAASATASAALTADLATAIDMAASLAATATATSDLSTAIEMAVGLSAEATVSANLAAGAGMAADLSGAATLTSDLTTAIPLEASVAASATVTADFSTAITFAMAATATATATGSLETAIPLAAAASGSASLSASLTTAVTLAAGPTASASVSAELQTAITFTAALLAQATVTADLTATALPTYDGVRIGGVRSRGDSVTGVRGRTCSVASVRSRTCGVSALRTATDSPTTVAAAMAASLAATASITASLSTATTEFASALSCGAAMSADLSTAIEGAAALGATATVTAALSAINMAAELEATCTASGALATAITFAASRTATATMTAALTVGEGEQALLQPADLSFAGYYGWPYPGFNMDASGAITLQEVGGEVHVFVVLQTTIAPIEKRLVEYRLPTDAPDPDITTAPRLTPLVDHGNIFINAFANSGLASADANNINLGGLHWDAANSGFWFSYGDPYGVAALHYPNLQFVSFTPNVAGGTVGTIYGPWRMAPQPNMTRGGVVPVDPTFGDAYLNGARFGIVSGSASGIDTCTAGCSLFAIEPFDPTAVAAATLPNPAYSPSNAQVDGAWPIMHDSAHPQTRDSNYRLCFWSEEGDPGHQHWNCALANHIEVPGTLWGGRVGSPTLANEVDSLSGAVWINTATKKGVVFFGQLTTTPAGYTPPGTDPDGMVHAWYGNDTTSPGTCCHLQPDTFWAGTHGPGSHYKVPHAWCYDPDDLIGPATGAADPWSLTPAWIHQFVDASGNLDFPGMPVDNQVRSGFFAAHVFHAATNRIYFQLFNVDTESPFSPYRGPAIGVFNVAP